MDSDSAAPFAVDKRWVKAAFNAAAADYDQYAVLQKEVGARLMERFDLVKITPQTVVDIGSGTGRISRAMGQRYPQARVISVDLAFDMLRQARTQIGWWQKWLKPTYWVCADAEHLPLNDSCADIIVSNLTLQWCTDPQSTFREFRRVLRPDGLLMFSSLGPDTLKELRDCWRAVDDYNHVNAFIDMHDLGDALIRAGFSTPVMDQEIITLLFPDIMQLMRELKAIGAHNVTAGRRRGLLGKHQFEKLAEAYEKFRSDGKLPCSYEVVYGHAWAPSANAIHEGETRVPLTKLRRRGNPS